MAKITLTFEVDVELARDFYAEKHNWEYSVSSIPEDIAVKEVEGYLHGDITNIIRLYPELKWVS